jgi:hypothetical protein
MTATQAGIEQDVNIQGNQYVIFYVFSKDLLSSGSASETFYIKADNKLLYSEQSLDGVYDNGTDTWRLYDPSFSYYLVWADDVYDTTYFPEKTDKIRAYLDGSVFFGSASGIIKIYQAGMGYPATDSNFSVSAGTNISEFPLNFSENTSLNFLPDGPISNITISGERLYNYSFVVTVHWTDEIIKENEYQNGGYACINLTHNATFPVSNASLDAAYDFPLQNQYYLGDLETYVDGVLYNDADLVYRPAWMTYRASVYNLTYDTGLHNILFRVPHNNPPTVSDISDMDGIVDQNVIFTFPDYDDPEGLGKSWVWHFGDSTTSTEENPVHSYSENGSYSANLTIYENATISPQTVIKNFTVDIGGGSVEPPVALFYTMPVFVFCVFVLFVYILRKKRENRKT